jgi:hypothetical protein
MNGTAGEPEVFHGVFIATTIFCFICSPVSCFGNFIILYAFYKNLDKKLRTPSSMLFVNLAVSDFLTGFLLGVLFSADALLDVFGINSVVLDAFTFVVGGLLVFANNFTITAISFDRLIAVVKPMHYKSIMTTKTMKLIISGIWLASLLICLLPLCISKWSFLLIFSHIHISLPLIFLTAMYLAIFKSIRKQRKKLFGPRNGNNRTFPIMAKEIENKRMERDRRLTVTIILVMVFFCVACLPIFIAVHLMIHLLNCEACGFSEYSKMAISSLCYFSARFVIFNTAIDPFLVYWRISKLRKVVNVTFFPAVCLKQGDVMTIGVNSAPDRRASANPVSLLSVTELIKK